MTTKTSSLLSTLPLIQLLRNPAIRPRHWDDLKTTINSV